MVHSDANKDQVLLQVPDGSGTAPGLVAPNACGGAEREAGDCSDLRTVSVNVEFPGQPQLVASCVLVPRAFAFVLLARGTGGFCVLPPALAGDA